MINKNILFIGIPESHIKNAIQSANNLRINIILCDSIGNIEKYKYLLDGVKDFVYADYTNYSELEQVAIEIFEKLGFTGIFTFKENALYNVAKLQRKFNLNGNSVECVSNCLDKYKTRKILKSRGIKSPDFALCKSEDEIYKFLNKNNFPVVIKPNNLQGSIGVKKINNLDEVKNVYLEYKELLKREEFLIESFIEAKEISIEAIVFRGKVEIFSMTEKFLYKDTFVESGHVSPYKPKDLYKIEEIVKKTIDALGIKLGPLHIEVFINNEDIIVGEVHTRYGGDNIVTLTELSSGCDMHSAIFIDLLHLNNNYSIGKIDSTCYSGIKFLDLNSGIVKRINGIEKLDKADECIKYEINIKVGDKVDEISSSYDRVGWVMSKGSTRDEVLLNLSKCLSYINIEILEEDYGK